MKCEIIVGNKAIFGDHEVHYYYRKLYSIISIRNFMMTQVSLKNVRIFGDELKSFELSPLTVFCGTNSSGKSTILKLLALLRQSHGIRVRLKKEIGGVLAESDGQINAQNT